MTWLTMFNIITSILLTICYTYQFYYIIYAMLVPPRIFRKTNQQNRYAVLISARNEDKVIGHLLDSIKGNDYPSDKVDIYVVADNCTDSTADVSREKGAFVYERFNTELVGKGYALNCLFSEIVKLHGEEYYNGYFVFDADNLLEKNYISEMDKCFCEGNRIITSYRNSKNYGSNWISAGYALWFIREAKYLNNARFLLGTSGAISGTGFLVHRDIFNKQGGWKHYLLTEDIEFTIDNVLHDEKIGYCHTAMLYDEQPISFKVSWRQRLRWSKGFLQVITKYGGALVKKVFKFKNFAPFDMLMTIAPAFILTVTNMIVNISTLIYAIVTKHEATLGILGSIAYTIIGSYMLLFVVGVITGIGEWEKIHCSTARKIGSFFTFPIFMLTYIPISIQAVFTNVEWKPIEHGVAVSMSELDKQKKAKK